MKIEEAKSAQVEIQRAVGAVNHLIQHTDLDVQLEIIQHMDYQVLIAKCYVEPTALDS